MRPQIQIDEQIKGLEKMKTTFPEYSAFGTPNHEIFDAQISILKGEIELEDLDEGDWNEVDETNEIYRGAEEAKDWLDEDRDEDLYE